MLLLAAGAILGGVVVVAMGRGGDMAQFRRDVPGALRPPRTPTEVATQRLPLGPVGYQVQATEEALVAAAHLLAERDQEIAALRREIWRLGSGNQAATAAQDRPDEGDDEAEDAADATQAGLASGGIRGVAPSGQHSGGIRGVAPSGQHSGGIRGVAPLGQHGTEQSWRQ